MSMIPYGRQNISQADIDAAYDAFKAFFALPDEVKRKYHVAGSGGARGYTPFGVETAKGSKHFDLKEFWHIGREIADDSKYRDVMATNLWPTEVEGFRDHLYGLFEAMDALGGRILRAIARHLGLGDGRGLAARDAEARLQRDQLRQLVGLEVRPQSLRAARQGDHAPEVFLDAVGEYQQCGRRGGGLVSEPHPGGRHGASSKMASISTAMFMGSGPMPTALRAPTPLSSPKTWAMSSL